MGYYLEVPKHVDKAQQLIELHGAEVLLGKPINFSDIPEDKALVCVVQNTFFDAAALCYSEREMLDFSDPMDFRPKTWLLMDKEKAHKLSGYGGALH